MKACICPVFFPFYDYTGILAYLKKMARKGWLLSGIRGIFWIFQRIEPQSLSFDIGYCTRMTQYDPFPTEEQLRYEEFCREGGWELLCRTEEMQLFVNYSKDPVPLDTDPALQTANIAQMAMKNRIPQNVFLIVFSAFNLWQELFRVPKTLPGYTPRPLPLACWAVIALTAVWDLLDYYHWQ